MSNIFLTFGFSDIPDLRNHHVTLLFCDDDRKGPEIASIVTDYFAQHTPSAIHATFSTEDHFGPENDVRVLIADDKEDFYKDLRNLLQPYSASQFEYQPHITTDLSYPQVLTFDRLVLSNEGYSPIQEWQLQ